MGNVTQLERSADVVVVGGGVVGLALARALAGRGASVVVVERGALGAEASWAAGGMLAPQAEADAADPFFALACASRDAYPALAAELLTETGIDIELDHTGTLYVAFTAADEAELAHRHAWQQSAGLAVEWLTGAAARALEPHLAPDVRAALRFPADGQVENRQLVAALVRSCELRGVGLHAHTAATAVRGTAGRVRGVETPQGFIAAGAVVVACGAWATRLRVAVADAAPSECAPPPVAPVRGQMLCFTAAPPLVRHVVYSARGYLVPRRDGRLLAGSTSERVGFTKAVTAAGLHAITTHALELAPAVAALPLVAAWSGLRPHAAAGYPVIGPCPGVPNLFYAAGHYRNGILLAPLTGELLAAVIAGHVAAPLLQPFTPERPRRALCAG